MKKALKELISEGVIWNGRKARTRVPVSKSDELFAELSLGAVHELCLKNGFEVKAKGAWYAPLFLVSALLEKRCEGSYIAWVGRRCWPTPQMLQETLGIEAQNRSLFIDPPDKQKRLWAALQLLKSPQVGCVVCDGSRFSLIATRRLQLAAHVNVLGILLRPPWEIEGSSCAVTKWRVQPVAADGFSWSIELLRARGLTAPKQWLIEWQEGHGNEKGALHCSANAASGAAESAALEELHRLAR